MSDTTRLNKIVAAHLGIGRRRADELIDKGKVRVNNSPARMGQQVSASDNIEVEGKQLHATDAPCVAAASKVTRQRFILYYLRNTIIYSQWGGSTRTLPACYYSLTTVILR
jgi:ribosomal 50S subunit-recycling heat shock protein